MKSKVGKKCKSLPKIYRYIGFLILAGFAIYIVSKTIKTQRNKNIEGFKKKGNKNIKEGNKNNTKEKEYDYQDDDEDDDDDDDDDDEDDDDDDDDDIEEGKTGLFD